MPVEIEIINADNSDIFNKVFSYLKQIDKKFSTYKKTSEVSRYNLKKLDIKNSSTEFGEVYKLCQKATKITNGFFNPLANNYYDPSGLVKGWSILNASKIIKGEGYKKYFISIGGDIEAVGKKWEIGIRHPFKKHEIVKIVKIKNKGIATSGNYERGLHIYNPQKDFKKANAIQSISVIANNIYFADIYATAAFAIGAKGINYIEGMKNAEGYQINKDGLAIMTSGCEKYI